MERYAVRLRLDGESFLLTDEIQPGFEPVAVPEAERILSSCLGDGLTPGASSEIRNLLLDLGLLAPGERLGDHELARRARELLHGVGARGLHLLREARRWWPAIDLKEDTVAPFLSELGGDAPVEELAWIEVVVIDQDDEPVSGVEYEIKLSDGRVRRSRTNQHGVLRYEHIPAGQCEVSLVAIDAALWDMA